MSTGTFPDNRSALCWFPLLVTAALLLVHLWTPIATFAAPQPGSTVPNGANQTGSIPSRSSNPDVYIEDVAGILSPDEFQALNLVMRRLSNLGNPTVLFIRDSSDATTAESWLAEDLRLGWSVESSLGARDGLVIVLSVNQQTPDESTISFSAGANAFPIRRLTTEAFATFVNDQALPLVQSGDDFTGLRDLLDLTIGTVVDHTGVLTERQLLTLDGDLRRLDKLGVPMLVRIQPAVGSGEGAQSQADQLRADWSVASAEGAEDGIVVVVTADQTNPANSQVVFSAGEDAFPIRQMTESDLVEIITTEALPEIQGDDVYLGLAYVVRRTINFAEYSPPEPSARTSVQDSLQTPLNITAAILLQWAVIGYILIPALLERRLTVIPSSASMATYAVLTTVLALLVAVAGAVGHSRVATLVGLGVFLWAVVAAPLFRSGLNGIRNWHVDRTPPPTQTAGGNNDQ